MLQWLRENSQLLSVAASMGMLLVWIIYLQVFMSSYHRQLRAKLLITRGAGDGIDARCFVCNMSAGPAFIQSVIVTVQLGHERWVCPVTDLLDIEEEKIPPEPKLKTRQGPLSTGEFKDIGSFRGIVSHVLREKQRQSVEFDHRLVGQVQAMEIEIVGVYGSEDLPVGAKRTFRFVESNGRLRLHGETLSTVQITSARERRQLVAVLKLDP